MEKKRENNRKQFGGKPQMNQQEENHGQTTNQTTKSYIKGSIQTDSQTQQ